MPLAGIYEKLFNRYGELNWWPARTPYEVIVGAILTQNCAWSNVEKAIANFGENVTPQFVAAVDTAKLAEIIRPAGFFNQKAAYLKAVTAWFAGYDYDFEAVREKGADIDKIRRELLSVRGVGRETADAILLYAFKIPTFVIDAYTMRLCARLPIDVGEGYDSVKRYFEADIPRETALYNNFHAAIVINAKEHCRKKPVCGGCPLAEVCKKL